MQRLAGLSRWGRRGSCAGPRESEPSHASKHYYRPGHQAIPARPSAKWAFWRIQGCLKKHSMAFKLAAEV